MTISKVDPDNGGHLFATIFNGCGDLGNLVPMNENLNKGQWEVMEKYWKGLLENPKIADVSIEIKIKYPSGKASLRPESFDVIATVTGTN